ncbi:hypothetical protein PLESTM_000640600 [Pleodorina starrii]|nr:hypothetical protein PLESTM_000640600 [Pleodorina starrii]
MTGTQLEPDRIVELFNLRERGVIPAGNAIYVQSGDSSDFDGYLIAAAGDVLQRQTPNLNFAVVVPERRAWRDKDEPDTTKHDPANGEEVLATAGAVLRHLCPRTALVRGPLNQRNLVPWRMSFNEHEKYGPLLQGLPPVDTQWTQLRELADRVLNPEVTSVLLDMNGSIGYLDSLVKALGPEGEEVLGRKMKAAGLPVVLMAGVQAELAPQTLPLPGRDPRATANAIYHPDGVRVLLRLAKEHDVPLLFVTNNACNRLLRFGDAGEVAAGLGLVAGGLLRRISDTWFGLPHLQGKCVPFDWVAFTAMLLYGREPSAMKLVRQELWVGANDSSVLVLRDTSQPQGDIVAKNLEGTELYGIVESVYDIDHAAMLALARHAAANAAANP